MSDVVLRPATPDDYDAWVAVMEEVAAEGRWIGAQLPFDEGRMRQRFEHYVTSDDAAMFLAEAPGHGVVGHLGIEKEGYGVADFGMAVVDGWRGKGVGSTLLRAATEWARDHGAHKITLQVWPHNTAAQALYEKFGFVVEGRLRRHYPRRNGELWDAVIMGLVLDEEAPGSSYH